MSHRHRWVEYCDCRDFAPEVERNCCCVNDTEEHAQALLKFCKVIPCKVNLIEYNPIDEGQFQQASEKALNMYMDLLERHGITTRIRKSRGKDIDAACGQLANKG